MAQEIVTDPVPTELESDKFYTLWEVSTAWNVYGNEPYATNPCPQGWRVPTKEEMVALTAHKSPWAEKDGIHGFTVYGSSGFSTNSIFLQAAGEIEGDGTPAGRDSYGRYWTCSQNDAYEFVGAALNNSNITIDGLEGTFGPARGFSVRCIANR